MSKWTLKLVNRIFCSQVDLKWNLTEEYKNLKHFVIIPFSKLYKMWFLIMFVATWYWFIVTPLLIAFKKDQKQMSQTFMAFDIFFTLIFILDILITPFIGMIENKDGIFFFTTDIKRI